MTGHFYLVGGRSGDSLAVPSSSTHFSDANRRFFPLHIQTNPVIPSASEESPAD